MPDRALTPTEVETIASRIKDLPEHVSAALCPFCAGSALGIRWGLGCYVRCLAAGCGARGPIGRSDEQAIEKWNARP